ncbi:LOB domain-containing protein 2-like [Pyrus x bretschneideri]|uniref:LOB domain-containing protein 2-like n=1 Tax=Pyrus x bretschneideri TaxID=225117 RepID=UPI0020309B5E|nr:LOB domain-containing protein 2-like [Pyrus x bretschneideri]
MGSSSSSGELIAGRHACAACRHQRKRCEDDCVMAPYFTNKDEDFKAVHKIFGVSNMTKLLKQLDDQNHRGTAVQSFMWEAYMWKQDPVNGPLGMYRKLEIENELLRNALNEEQKALNYGYANQSLAIDGSSNGTYTKLLQGQEATEISREQQVLGQGRGFHHGAALAKQQARDQQGVVGLDSSAGQFGMVGLMSTQSKEH